MRFKQAKWNVHPQNLNLVHGTYVIKVICFNTVGTGQGNLARFNS